MGNLIEKLMMAITVPLLILKWVGWVGCAIWLLCLGDWRVVVASLLAGWIGGFVLPLASGIIMIPFLPFVGKAERSPIVGGIMAVLARIPTCALLIAWCIFCMFFVMMIKGLNETTVVPRLLMSYCMAIHTIWNLTADNHRESGGCAANFLSVMLCAVGYLVVVILMLCGIELSLLGVICILAGFLAISIPVSVMEVVSVSSYRGY